jgi:predicted TIM-barrel fold metal-dependent hydrolase
MSNDTDRGPTRAKIIEEPIRPELPIIDAHHHLWPDHPPTEAYPLEALIADKAGSGHNIRQTVFVEGWMRYRKDGPPQLRPVGEIEFANAMGERADRMGGKAAGACAGLVGCADLTLGDAVEEVLQAHDQAAPDRLRGIRSLVVCDPEYRSLGTRPNMLGEAKVRAAATKLVSNNLSLDIFVMHPQLNDVAELARAFPDLRIILDHLGAPMRVGRFADDREAAFQDWLGGMRRVAAHANVKLKLGGLNSVLTGLGAPLNAAAPWSSDRLLAAQRRHLLTAIELFGVNRCMFESNFPVDRVTVSAAVLWNTFKKLVADFSPDEQARLFFGTAAEFYRLRPEA